MRKEKKDDLKKKVPIIMYLFTVGSLLFFYSVSTLLTQEKTRAVSIEEISLEYSENFNQAKENRSFFRFNKEEGLYLEEDWSSRWANRLGKWEIRHYSSNSDILLLHRSNHDETIKIFAIPAIIILLVLMVFLNVIDYSLCALIDRYL